jgi:hypothetical protein
MTKPQAWRQIGQRGYASHGHEATKAGGDLPWYVLKRFLPLPIDVTQA